MKSSLLLAAACTALTLSVSAAPSIVDSSYHLDLYQAHSNSDSIVSYDWSSSGSLYYMTVNNTSFQFGGLFQNTGSGATNVVPANTDFAGASVVASGNYIYFNTTAIYKYGPVNGTPALSLASTTLNYTLTARGNSLFITGASGFNPNHIFYSNLDANGNFLSSPAIDLGEDSGGSGPLTFDSAGNLYYAPGFSDTKIYRWSAADVAAAIANPTANPLGVDGKLWLDYSTLYAEVSGASSMLIDPSGNLLVTLTSFSEPSSLVSFGVGTNGTYSGTANTILQDAERLGELRLHNGSVYLSAENNIYQVVPEPSSALLAGLGALLFLGVRRRRKAGSDFLSRTAQCAGAGLAVITATAQAGPYSPAADQPGSTAISADSPIISGWATGILDVVRGPVDITVPGGATASFGTAADALGRAGATPDDPLSVVSLGDGGRITLSFDQPIFNGTGADFAVFENSFKITGSSSLYFCELAFVDVSSDGVNFFRFNAISLTQATTQVASFAGIDPTNIYNLAGRDIAGYGTPFDLQEMVGRSSLLDVNSVRYIRLTDVVGTINPTYATTDSLGNIINDPYKTNFAAGGFDLDGVGAIHQIPEPSSMGLAALGLAGLGLVRIRPQFGLTDLAA